MRTRRSPRNQDRLYRYLTPVAPREIGPEVGYTPIPGERLFDAIQRLGMKHANHYSDLYIPVTPLTRLMVRAHGVRPEIFVNQVEGGMWYDCPFAYLPYWDECARKAALREPAQ